MDKTSRLKEKRHQIYDSINEYVGPMSKGTQAFLSEMLQDYAKIYEEHLLEELQILEKKIVTLNGILASKSTQNKPKNKPVYSVGNNDNFQQKVIKKKPYFNNDFIQHVVPETSNNDGVKRDLVLE